MNDDAKKWPNDVDAAIATCIRRRFHSACAEILKELALRVATMDRMNSEIELQFLSETEQGHAAYKEALTLAVRQCLEQSAANRPDVEQDSADAVIHKLTNANAEELDTYCLHVTIAAEQTID